MREVLCACVVAWIVGAAASAAIAGWYGVALFVAVNAGAVAAVVVYGVVTAGDADDDWRVR